KPHQILQDASGGGPHLMHQGHGQPASAVPPCRRVLADVGPARVDAETFDVARRPVRHAAPAPHQDRRPRRRDEDDDPSALADLLPRAGYPALRSRTHTAPRHLTGGARAPRIFTIVPSTANPPRPKLWLQAGADTARPNAGEIQRNHPRTPPTTAELPKRCIKRASSYWGPDRARARALRRSNRGGAWSRVSTG